MTLPSRFRPFFLSSSLLRQSALSLTTQLPSRETHTHTNTRTVAHAQIYSAPSDHAALKCILYPLAVSASMHDKCAIPRNTFEVQFNTNIFHSAAGLIPLFPTQAPTSLAASLTRVYTRTRVRAGVKKHTHEQREPPFSHICLSF